MQRAIGYQKFERELAVTSRVYLVANTQGDVGAQQVSTVHRAHTRGYCFVQVDKDRGGSFVPNPTLLEQFNSFACAHVEVLGRALAFGRNNIECRLFGFVSRRGGGRDEVLSGMDRFACHQKRNRTDQDPLHILIKPRSNRRGGLNENL